MAKLKLALLLGSVVFVVLLIYVFWFAQSNQSDLVGNLTPGCEDLRIHDYSLCFRSVDSNISYEYDQVESFETFMETVTTPSTAKVAEATNVEIILSDAPIPEPNYEEAAIGLDKPSLMASVTRNDTKITVYYWLAPEIWTVDDSSSHISAAVARLIYTTLQPNDPKHIQETNINSINAHIYADNYQSSIRLRRTN